MKLGSIILTTLTVATLASTAQAEVKVSELTSLNIDEQIFKLDPRSQQLGGQISVDTEKNTATISVVASARCVDPTRPCPKYLRRVIGETLPIVQTKVGNCGETIITAEENRMPVDGAKMELEIIDNTTIDRCAFFRAPDPLTATYKTTAYNRMESTLVTTTSTFVGTELK